MSSFVSNNFRLHNGSVLIQFFGNGVYGDVWEIHIVSNIRVKLRVFYVPLF
jgi:hypothetical protein